MSDVYNKCNANNNISSFRCNSNTLFRPLLLYFVKYLTLLNI